MGKANESILANYSQHFKLLEEEEICVDNRHCNLKEGKVRFEWIIFIRSSKVKKKNRAVNLTQHLKTILSAH